MNDLYQAIDAAATRKACSWKEIGTVRMTQAEFDLLPKHDILGETPQDNFTAQTPQDQYFIARASHGTYVINHEGYRYPRYAARVSIIPAIATTGLKPTKPLHPITMEDAMPAREKAKRLAMGLDYNGGHTAREIGLMRKDAEDLLATLKALEEKAVRS